MSTVAVVVIVIVVIVVLGVVGFFARGQARRRDHFVEPSGRAPKFFGPRQISNCFSYSFKAGTTLTKL